MVDNKLGHLRINNILTFLYLFTLSYFTHGSTLKLVWLAHLAFFIENGIEVRIKQVRLNTVKCAAINVILYYVDGIGINTHPIALDIGKLRLEHIQGFHWIFHLKN